MWQFRHMHTLHFDINSNREAVCPTCGDIYQNRKTMTTNTTATPAEGVQPSSPKSTLVLISLIFLFAAFAMAIIAALFIFPFVAILAVVDGLAAVTFAVLSLRERV